MQPLADREGARCDVVIETTGLCQGIGGIHGEKGKHQQHLYNQDDVGVVLRPSFHFRTSETRNRKHVSPHQEDHTSHQNTQGEPLKGGDHHIVKATEKGRKHPVGAKQAVYKNLEDFDVDENEPGIDHDVHDAGHGPNDHFGLAHGHPGHQCPPFLGPV